MEWQSLLVLSSAINLLLLFPHFIYLEFEQNKTKVDRQPGVVVGTVVNGTVVVVMIGVVVVGVVLPSVVVITPVSCGLKLLNNFLLQNVKLSNVV